MELAASAVAAAGLKLLNCNRSNFFENLKLQQSRKFRRQQIIAAQANLFRSDVQQVIGASVTVQERLMVVSTLMLVASTYSFGLALPADSADFVEGLAYLCMSNSCLHFLLALFSCITASILARTSQKVLLNNCVRPPFEEMMAAVDDGEVKERAEHFEQQGVSALLRLPGMSLLEKQFGKALLKERKLRSAQVGDEEGARSLNRLRLRQSANDEAMNRLQNLWDDLAAYAPYYLSWGVRNLLQAYAFRSMTFYYPGNDFYVFGQTAVWITLALALGILTDMAMPTCCSQNIAEHALLLLGVGLSLGANWTKFRASKIWWKREGLNRDFIWIVMAFGCQLGLLLSAHVRFYMNTKGGPMLQTFRDLGGPSFTRDFRSFSDLELSEGSSSEEGPQISGLLQDHIKRQSRMRDGVRTTCLVANGAMILIWLGVCFAEAAIWRRLPTGEPMLPLKGDNVSARSLKALTGSRPLVLTISTPARRRVRAPGDSTVAELLEAQGLKLSLGDRLMGRRLVVRSNRTQLSPELPLSVLTSPELSVEVQQR